MEKLITHDTLLAAGFQQIENRAKNVYVLENPEAEGLYLDTSVTLYEYKDTNSPYKYAVCNGPYELPDLNEGDWKRLVRTVKNCIGLNIEEKVN